MPGLTRLIYMDDSGVESHGWVVYGWVECAPERWNSVLRAWLDLRKRLFASHAIAPATELHSTKFINGRAHISTVTPANNEWKTLGRTVAVECLQTISQCSDLSITTVFSRTTLRGKDFHQHKARCYARTVEMIERELADVDEYGIINMDGNGTDRSYYDAHRQLKLDTRHIIEDPLFHESHRSQWIQMADLVAYVTYLHLAPHDGNVYARDWYDTYLRPRADGRDPIDLDAL